jgi:hypothetical protein
MHVGSPILLQDFAQLAVQAAVSLEALVESQYEASLCEIKSSFLCLHADLAGGR